MSYPYTFPRADQRAKPQDLIMRLRCLQEAQKVADQSARLCPDDPAIEDIAFKRAREAIATRQVLFLLGFDPDLIARGLGKA